MSWQNAKRGRKELMKKLLLALLILFVLPQPLKAKEFSWQGTQVLAVAGGAIELIEKKLSLIGSAVFFWVPESGVNLFFFYFGPKWQIADWIWIAPQVGLAGHWDADGKDAADFSLWIGLSFFDSQFTIFLEGDAIINADQKDYYGFYSIDYNPLDWFNAGIHGEQINEGIQFGPHVGFTKGPWHLEIQHYTGLQDVNYGHTVRILTKLFF